MFGIFRKLVLIFLLKNLFLLSENEFCSNLGFPNCSSCEINKDLIRFNCDFNQTCQNLFVANNVENRSVDFEKKLSKVLEENSKITSLYLNGTLLESIPPVICSLPNIQDISITYSCLNSLPGNCFKKLKTLKRLILNNNQIEIIKSGLFNGLNDLAHLDLSYNQIKIVHDDVFSNATDLLSLRHLDLSYNRLTRVDAWIFIRGIAVKQSFINFRENDISSITNNGNWTFTCQKNKGNKNHFDLSLYRNKLEHVSDLLIFFPRLVDLVCLYGKKSSSEVTIQIDHNELICDCIDYKIAKFIGPMNYVSILDNVHCRKPQHLYHRKIVTLTLEEFVCEMAPCPSGCICIEQTHGYNIIINCTSTNLPNLPSSLPENTSLEFSKYRYTVNLSYNHIESIQYQNYFNRTKILDLSFNIIKQLDLNTLKSLANLEELNLHGNLLRILPIGYLSNYSFSLRSISLHENPWDCSCENKWLKEWLENLQNKSYISIKNPRSILCHTPTRLFGKNILSFDDVDEFCFDPYLMQRKKILMSTLIPLFSAILAIVLLYFIVRKFKVELNTYLNIHPLDRDECKGENMEYDAFISCSFSDRKRGIELVLLLEEKGYRVCYHEKDFVGGQSIASNIVEAVIFSKRVICLMTADFLNSSYCMFEFQTSLHRNIEINRKRLIVLLDQSVEVKEVSLPKDVYNFLTSHTYIEMSPNKKWIDQLFYSLPLKPIKWEQLRAKVIAGT